MARPPPELIVSRSRAREVELSSPNLRYNVDLRRSQASMSSFAVMGSTVSRRRAWHSESSSASRISCNAGVSSDDTEWSSHYSIIRARRDMVFDYRSRILPTARIQNRLQSSVHNGRAVERVARRESVWYHWQRGAMCTDIFQQVVRLLINFVGWLRNEEMAESHSMGIRSVFLSPGIQQFKS